MLCEPNVPILVLPGQRIAEITGLLSMQVMIAEREDRAGKIGCRLKRYCGKVHSIIIPQTSETINIISTAELDAMKHSAVIVNVLRGGVVDEATLLRAL